MKDETMFSEFQIKAGNWLRECMGNDVFYDKKERNHRFAEEALELLQACGYPKEDLLAMVEEVYSKPASTEIGDEVGDVLVCLGPLATVWSVGCDSSFNRVIRRNWENIEKIRAKHNKKELVSTKSKKTKKT